MPENRGTLKIFLGYAPGVGKAKVMVDEAIRRKSRGQDVVIAIITQEDRLFSQEFSADITELEMIPPAKYNYAGEERLEMDISAIIARKPDVVLVDNLSHVNPSGSARERRWEDVEEILRNGIDVLSTMNVMHLESLNDTIFEITGKRIQNTVPDRLFHEADEVEMVDLSPKALMNRVRRGDVVAKGDIDGALKGLYREVTLNALRELAMREIAGRVDEDLTAFRKSSNIIRPWQTSDRMVICISPTRSSLRMIRRGWRLAQKTHSEVKAIYVPEEMNEVSTRILADDKKLCERLGIPVVRLDGEEPSEAIISYVQKNNVTQIIIGHTDRTRVQEFLRGSLLLELAKQLKTVDIMVIATETND